jgi:hypothetical protein
MIMAKMTKSTTRRRSLPAKVDPVIALTASADRLLDEYIGAKNAVELARAKLGRDARAPSVAPPALGLWGAHMLFTSEDHIEEEFQRVTKRLRDEIKNARAGKQPDKERIARNQAVLAMLPKFKEPLKKEFRQEQRRLLKVQKKAGLTDGCYARKNKAWLALRTVTEQIAKAKPATTQGALAMIDYVQLRSRSDLAEFFSDRDMPGQFGQVLRSAHQLLRRSIAA